MAMSGMGADCPMASQAATEACAPDCCAAALPQTIAVLAAAEKRQLNGPAPALRPFVAAAGAEAAPLRQAPLAAPAASPPLYLLHRVFRI